MSERHKSDGNQPHWHPTRNGSLQETELPFSSHKKVWWQCSKGHEWQATAAGVRFNGSGCPYCTGHKAIPGETDLLTLYPTIAAQWDTERNTGYDPRLMSPSAHHKVWWRCSQGHSWQAKVFSRTKENGSGCPYCTGRSVLPGYNDLATRKPKLAAQWHTALNGSLSPSDVSCGSNKKVWWHCEQGHVWQAAIYSRTRQKASGCPVCAGSKTHIPIVYPPSPSVPSESLGHHNIINV